MAYVPPHKRGNAAVVPSSLSEGEKSANNSGGRSRRNEANGRFSSYDSLSRRQKYGRNDNANIRHGNSNSRWNVGNEKNNDLHVLLDACSYIYCINLKSRADKWENFQRQTHRVDKSFCSRIHRFEAINGHELVEHDIDPALIKREWDTYMNAMHCPNDINLRNKTLIMNMGEVGCALSHIALWQILANSSTGTTEAGNDPTTLIFEDDAMFNHAPRRDQCKQPYARGSSRFLAAFVASWKSIPSDWDILYLGFNSRGERHYVNNSSNDDNNCETKESTNDVRSHQQVRSLLQFEILIYKPTYGYHLHAYLLKQSAARSLLANLPVSGPIDVWLADNNWFGLSVYCTAIANEGYMLPDGSYEGSDLVGQDRRRGYQSDVQQRKR